jgi:putative transposase
LSPARRRLVVKQACELHQVSERRACRVLGQSRTSQRYGPKVAGDENALTARIIDLASKYGRYGYRRITALLRNEGWRVNHKRGRLWLNDGSCVRLRPEHRNHVWTYDFVFDRTHNGRALKMLTVVDEYSRESLAIEVDRRLTSKGVIRVLAKLMLKHGIPGHIRSDNGPEFVAKVVREWLHRLGVETLFIEPGSPWENGYIESFNGKLRDELLNGEIFYTLPEARVLIEMWRRHYNQVRPHSSLGYRPPAPEAAPGPSIEAAS